MSDESIAQISLGMLKQDLTEAQKRQNILCPLLVAMQAQYKADGELNPHLADHVQVLMSELYNYLASMEVVLLSEDLPF